MDMQIAVCYAPHDLRIERRAVEPLAPDEVLVKVGYCGVCPWDVRVYAGRSSSVRFPLFMGHEVSGVVEAVGSGVTSVSPGQRVAVDVIRRCGQCPACRRGMENHCQKADYSRGGYAEYLAALATNVYPIRSDTSMVEAALAEPLACVVRAQNRLAASPGDLALVMGAGPLGLLHLQVLKSRGARVLVCDPVDERLVMARRLGAAAGLNPTYDDLSRAVDAYTDGRGVDVAVIATSTLEAARQALPLLGANGRLLLFGGIHPKADWALDPNLIHYREIWITGSSDYTPAEFAAALRLIEDGVLTLRPLISHVYPLAKLPEALDALEQHAGLKVVVRCNDLEPFEPEVQP